MGVAIAIRTRGSVPTFDAGPALRRANERVARLGERAARLYAAKHTRSGDMARSLRPRVLGAGGVEWHYGAPQALFLEEGTKAHVIRPTPKRQAKAKAEYARAKAAYEATGRWPKGARRTPHAYLSFAGPSGPIFARSVRHPGTPARPHLDPAIRDNAGIFENIYADEVEGAWSRG